MPAHTFLESTASELIARARAEGREVLYEHEGLEILRQLDIRVPTFAFVEGSRGAALVNLSRFGSDRVVIKVVSTEILHKTEVGGVVVVPRDIAAIVSAIERMELRLAGHRVAGFLICQYVPHDDSIAGELLLGARWTDDFGPVVTFGPGGIHAEVLAEALTEDAGTAVFSPLFGSREAIESVLSGRAVARLLEEPIRGRAPRTRPGDLARVIGSLLEYAAEAMPHDLVEFEINPLVLAPEGPVALDALGKLGPAGARAAAPARPLHRLRNLLLPRTIGIIGVSEKMNPGHIILNNIIAEGFPRDRIHVIKPGTKTIEGCRCVEDLASLPCRVDLLVVCVGASQVPDLVEGVAAGRRARSLIVIPGGMGEHHGGESIERRVERTLAGSRSTPWRGPLVNGGNCLGIRSRPGRYDTLFIPGHKLRERAGREAPLAVISQSGAFAVSRLTKLAGLDPRYLVSLGNQIDLTVSDYLDYLADDHEVDVFACYVEGFKPLDGRKFLEAARRIVHSGRTVILYRAGRTAAGARATASHTASIAGDYTVTRELARAAGVVMAGSLADFEDLVSIFCALRRKRVGGLRLGAISNAGFECVAMADSAGRFQMEGFTPETAGRLRDLLKRCRLDGIVEVHNPMDVTPIMNDAAFEEAVRCVLQDPSVDAGIVGIVPMTGALSTLARSRTHGEDLAREDSVARRLVRLAGEIPKPWIAVVDGGQLYDPLAAHLRDNGVPTFRTADRALRLFETFCLSRRACLA